MAGLDLSRFTFERADFREVIDRTDEFLYLDPVYMCIDSMYIGPGWSAVDHLDLFDLIKDRSKWVMHYGDVPDVRALYSGFPMISLQWWNGFSKRLGRELIILPRR